MMWWPIVVSHNYFYYVDILTIAGLFISLLTNAYVEVIVTEVNFYVRLLSTQLLCNCSYVNLRSLNWRG